MNDRFKLVISTHSENRKKVNYLWESKLKEN